MAKLWTLVSLFADTAESSFHMRFFLHTGVLENIGPLATRPSMTVFQMLPEMVRPEELLHVIALAEFVLRGQMLKPLVPVRARKI